MKHKFTRITVNARMCKNPALHKKCKLSRNSASGYFNSFLGIVHLAYKDNILTKDYASCVKKITWDHDIHKEYLSKEEIKQLASTPYEEIPNVYRAGMFSIYTGLRRSDILALRWDNIYQPRGRKAYLKFCIKKTGVKIQLPLTLAAIRILGTPKSGGKVFPELTESILITHVERWIRKAPDFVTHFLVKI